MNIIHGTWDHIFEDDGRALPVRFCFDVEKNKLVHLDIQRDTGWEPASSVDVADVQDSILNGNADALDNPSDYGLAQTAELPDWAAGAKESQQASA